MPELESQHGVVSSGGSSPAKTSPYASKIDAIEERINQLNDEVEKSKRINIEVLAVFTALFTFVSIEFQLIQQFDYLNFLYLSIFFCGLLLGFVLILDLIIQEKPTVKFTITVALVITMIIAGFIHLDAAKVTTACPQIDKPLVTQILQTK